MALNQTYRFITRGFCKNILHRNNTSFYTQMQRHTRYLSAMSEQFNQAKEKVPTLTKDPGNEVKLKMYALFKQGSVGACNAPKPGALDFVGKAKWNAWNDLGNLSQEDAQKQYIALVESLLAQEPSSSNKAEKANEAESGDFEHILVTQDGGLTTITLNRPTKYNALNPKMYLEIIQALKQAGEDNSVVTLITGAGQYFCSGNDLTNFLNIPPEGPEKMAADGRELLREFVKTFIDFPKPIVAAVNGPAVGISVTLLGLLDMVYASDKATFHTPFMTLGQSPEACSSYLFPKIMGQAKAHEVLLAGKKLNAVEACNYGLVTEVIPQAEFEREVNKKMKYMAGLPPQSLALSKQLCRSAEKDKLHDVNNKECELLAKRWLSDECAKAVMAFMQRKAKM
ncbi:enoyl-CoA delta isomerase 2, mitochondrial-like [Dendronephthya gigantea]|uniref:enoyl-CoA delta isomerase 2, mitochondrial-like n=1 Tax=Dendronephthya gigantea TaxID=151771 RepID=UPI00106CDE84|nr:enoyl-CoA delta isomerase 2, mitochondrial-like [Dendronephthya gigantea]